jgi:hypothetical protein
MELHFMLSYEFLWNFKPLQQYLIHVLEIWCRESLVGVTTGCGLGFDFR